MRVAILGAGISGIACARHLVQAGVSATILEKSRGVGGRVATRRVGPYIFDSGAQSLASPPNELTDLIQNGLPHEALHRIDAPIFTHDSLHVSPGDSRKNATPRFTFRGGLNTLAKLLSEDLDVRRETAVEAIERNGSVFSIGQELFDAVVLTMPVPQASLLLWPLGERRPTGPSRYRSCLSILLGYAQPAPTQAYHALINVEGNHPLQWLGLESVKSPDRAPEGHTALVAQMSAAFSLSAWDWPQERLVETAAAYVSRLYGPKWLHPEVSDVMKWKYSQPEMVVGFESVNPPGSKLILTGDGLAGGRIEHAFAAGVKAATLLLESK
jgi:predicted NAD/FAD-dependent oxidoreductase